MQRVHPQPQQDHLNRTVEKLQLLSPGAWPQDISQNRQNLTELRPKIRDREAGHRHLVLGSARTGQKRYTLAFETIRLLTIRMSSGPLATPLPGLWRGFVVMILRKPASLCLCRMAKPGSCQS